MYKIAAVGDSDSIGGFAAVGLDVFTETEPEAAGATIRSLAESGYAVIYVTEALASRLTDVLERYKSMRIPVVVPIPGVTGNTGIGMRGVAESVERAVGSDILSDAASNNDEV